ncbi:hypothetical protein GCM10027059_00020 [Myceligenerans halotolerans]
MSAADTSAPGTPVTDMSAAETPVAGTPSVETPAAGMPSAELSFAGMPSVGVSWVDTVVRGGVVACPAPSWGPGRKPVARRVVMPSILSAGRGKHELKPLSGTNLWKHLFYTRARYASLPRNLVDAVPRACCTAGPSSAAQAVAVNAAAARA